ncbi:MAG: hypothetical protein K6C97_12245 [Treponema sp.]|nr:hypothetical protein [Treponema sp.]
MKIEDINVPLDSQKIEAAVQNEETIEIVSYALYRGIEEYVNNLLTVFLTACKQEDLLSSMSYSSGELLANANKANAKRVYFQEKGLDINNPEDYKHGMVTFSAETTVNKEHYQRLQKEQDLYIKYLLSIKNNVITLEVVNKSVLTETEKARIQGKMESARKYNSMEDALTDIDRTEGSGLGLIIIILMLKQLGIKKECLQVEGDEIETRARIVIPIDEIVPPSTNFGLEEDLECI